MSIIAQKRVGFGGFSAYSLLSALIEADHNYRARRHLARLDKTQLLDMGIK